MTQYTTPHSLPLIEPAVDTIRSATGDNVWKQLNAISMAANLAISKEGSRSETDAIETARTYTDTQAAFAAWFKGGPPEGTVDARKLLSNGAYTMATQGIVDGITNLPPGVGPGVFEARRVGSGVTIQTYWDGSGNGDVWVGKVNTSGVIEAWKRLGPFAQGNIPVPTNLANFRVPGIFTVNNQTAVDNTSGLPVGVPGILANFWNDGSVLGGRLYFVYGPKPALYWQVSSDIAGNLTPWLEVGGAGAATSNHQHEVRLSDLRNRTPIRPAGKAALCIIFDHGTNNFKDIVLPALKARGLTATLALNSDMYNPAAFRYATDNKTTWAIIRGWALNDGIEIANHGRTHDDATSVAAIEREVIDGRKELEAALPGVPIDSWVQPGAAYGAFGSGETLEAYYATDAGRIIIDGHAVISGGAPGPLAYNMDGHPSIGMKGTWLDTEAGIASAKARISEAIANGQGTILRAHPELLNTSGRTTTGELMAFLDYVKGLVDSGKIMVTTFRQFALQTY